MALADIRTKDMDASVSAVAEASGLAAQLRVVADFVGLLGAAGFGWLARITWRASARVTKIETAQATQVTINAEVKTQIAAQAASHGKLEVAVAQLPTRDELTELFRDLRQDIRDLRVRRGKTAPAP